MADLHALVAGFADVAAAYERGRPEYGPAVIGAIVGALGAPPGARVLDVGAGTGKLARPLVRAGFDVVAVEPLTGMRAALTSAIGAQRVRNGRAEALPLQDASVDAAVCGDAFHWFDGDRAAAELFRTVRAGGGVVACWLTSSPGDGARPPFAVALGRHGGFGGRAGHRKRGAIGRKSTDGVDLRPRTTYARTSPSARAQSSVRASVSRAGV